MPIRTTRTAFDERITYRIEHGAIEFRFSDSAHWVPVGEISGREVTLYEKYSFSASELEAIAGLARLELRAKETTSR